MMTGSQDSPAANNHFSGLDQIFQPGSQEPTIIDVVPTTSQDVIDVPVLATTTPIDTSLAPSVTGGVKSDLDYDYKKIRKSLTDTIEQSVEALDALMNLAMSSDSPRAFEVVAQLLQTRLDASMRLLEMHERMNGLQGGSNNNGTYQQIQGQTNIKNQAIFVGNTSELLELIQKSKKQLQDTMKDIVLREPDRSDIV